MHLEEPKLQTMLVTIGAFRHPKHRTSKPYDSSLLRRGSAGYPNKKAKKNIYIYIEIARDLFSLPIMLRALSCFFFSFSPAFLRHNDGGDGNENGIKAIGLFVTARLQRESASFHVLSRTGTQDNNFLFLFLNFDTVL